MTVGYVLPWTSRARGLNGPALCVAVAALLVADPLKAQETPPPEDGAPAQNQKLITLDDLRKALTKSETPSADGAQAKPAETPETSAGAEGIPEATQAQSEATFTLDDLRRALSGQPVESEEAQAVAEATEEAAPDDEETPEAPGEADGETGIALEDAGDEAVTGEEEPAPTQLAAAPPAEPVVERATPPIDQPDPERRPGEPAASQGAPSASAAPAGYASDPSNWSCKLSTRVSVKASDGFDEETGKLSLYFGSGEFALSQAGIATLAREGQVLQDIVSRGERITIVGNADGTGNESANVILSLQRAYNIKACIMQLIGIPEPSLTISGHGSFSAMFEPKEPTEAGNRRVDIVAESTFRERFEAALSELNE